jgi:hypothetical protein
MAKKSPKGPSLRWARGAGSAERAATRLDAGSRAVPDCSTGFLPVAGWLGDAGRGAALERYAESLLTTNAGVLQALGVEAAPSRRGGVTGLAVRTSTRVGAIPLRSPATGRADFGLVVSPRFSWLSIGEALGVAGFRVTPELLPLPTLPQSERAVPPWVLASVVLARVEALLLSMTRRFVVTRAVLPAPRGQIDVGRWATEGLARGRPLAVPCAFPDLRDDERLRAAIHWVVRRQVAGLRGAAAVGSTNTLRPLLDRCERILSAVGGTPAVRPASSDREQWSREPLRSKVFRDGLEAIGWTADETGLAGLAETSGLSWRLDMERFFEAWVESLADGVSRRIGAVLRAGRTEATRVPLSWEPRGVGGLQSLLPDLVLARADRTIVIDAKYKPHGEALGAGGRGALREDEREVHRDDVLQALAYSSLFATERVTAVLAYPCRIGRWQTLSERGRTHARANVSVAAGRRVDLVVCALPLGVAAEEGRQALIEAIGS